MIYKDSVYGKINIEEKVIIDLINSKAMQRLKGVLIGPTQFLNKSHFLVDNKNNRFDHSVGVYILLRRFNASIEEQIAGLLHDISHTAFSHAIDFVFNKNVEQNFHEEFYEKIISKSDIPKILNKNGIKIKDVMDETKFTLLERELPDICADRVDYFLRDMVLYDSFIKQNVNKILNSIIDFNHEMIFNDLEMARIFAEKFIEINKLIYCNSFQSFLFHNISGIVKIGFDKGIINEDDLFTTDEEVISKLKNSGDHEIMKKIKIISESKIIENEKDYDLHLKTKIRITDPKIKINGKIVRLSDADESYKNLMNDYAKKTSNGFFIKIINS